MSRPSVPKTPRDAHPTTDLLGLVPVARSSVVDAVAAKLEGEILAGRIAAGTRLPPERELSVGLGVNRLTLRSAMSRLEALGLIATRHGAGTVVTSWRERAGLDTLPRRRGAMSPGEPAWRKLVADVLEVRRAISAEAVALAAARHTEAHLTELRRVRDAQQGRLDDALAYARGDLEFQRALVRAADNVGFELVLNSLARFPDELPDLVARLYDRRHETVAFYDTTLAILATRDGDAARGAVRTALEALDAEWLARHAPPPGRASKRRPPPSKR